MKEKYERIINYYGFRHQLKKLSEEVYELQEALLDFDNNQSNQTLKKHAEEELADVNVILTELSLFFELNRDRMIDVMDSKVNRQIKRMKRRCEVDE